MRSKFSIWVEENGLRITFIAKKLGISKAMVYYLMNGERTPSKEIALKIEELTKGEIKCVDWPQATFQNTDKKKATGLRCIKIEDEMKNLKQYLDENRITYREFAEKLEIQLSSLKNIVYGKRRPSLEVAAKIEDLTNGEIRLRNLLAAFDKIRKADPKKKTSRKYYPKKL